MDQQNLSAQLKLFHKYWYGASDSDSVKDFQTADQLRAKIVPQIETLIDEDSRAPISDLYSNFAEFAHEYTECLRRHNREPSVAHETMKAMADRAVQLNSDSFSGRYYLAVYHSWNQTAVSAGSQPAIYRGEDAATSIVGTAFSLLSKGITLGATAAVAGVTKSAFANSVQNLIAAYKHNIQGAPIEAGMYLKMTSRMFNMAEYCEDVNSRLARDIYVAIKGFDADTLDYSEFESEQIPEIMEGVMEFLIVADSKS